MKKLIRKAFVMSVHEGREAEYARRHNPIWEELEEVLRSHGVSNYSIFLQEETRQLFGYAEIESEEQWAAIAETKICRKWWNSMKELMPSHEDGSPVAENLRQVFFME